MKLGKTSIHISPETGALMDALFPGQGAGRVFALLLRRAEREAVEDRIFQGVIEQIEARFAARDTATAADEAGRETTGEKS